MWFLFDFGSVYIKNFNLLIIFLKNSSNQFETIQFDSYIMVMTREYSVRIKLNHFNNLAKFGSIRFDKSNWAISNPMLLRTAQLLDAFATVGEFSYLEDNAKVEQVKANMWTA